MSPILRPNHDNTGGDAHFVEFKHDLRPFWGIGNGVGINAVPLGLNKQGGNTGALWNLQKNEGHSLVFSPNRTGKGASSLVGHLMSYGGSVFCLDPKGENYGITSVHSRRMGQRTILLDPWGEVQKRFGSFYGVTEKVTRFNPLSFIDPRSRSYAQDVAAIADALIITTPGEHPHWPDSAREFVSGLIALVKEIYGDRASLRQVRKLMNTSVADLLKSIAVARHSFPDSLAALKLSRFTEDTSEEVKNVRGTAITQTGFLDDPDLTDAMESETPPFELDQFVSRPTSIYVVIPPAYLITYARWMRMIVTLTMRAITRAPQIPKLPALLLIDEMGTIGPLRTLEQAYGLLAGYGIRLVGYYQSLAQMKTDYPTSWSNFINNCSVVQVMGARDLEGAQYFSDLLGNITLKEQHGEWLDRMIAGSSNPRKRPQGSRPLMTAQEIMSLLGKHPDRLQDNTQLVMMMQGGENALLLQNPYFCQNHWAGLYRVPPQYARKR